MAEPTEGPWMVRYLADDTPIIVKPGYGGPHPKGGVYLPVPIARVGVGHDRPQEEAVANAHILAAALEMWAALASLLESWPDPAVPMDALVAKAFHQDATAAVAKAKGGA